MKPWIARLVAYFLIPTILLDPSIGGRGPSRSETRDRGMIFTDQAMSLPDLSVHSPHAPAPAALVRQTSGFAGRRPDAAPPQAPAALHRNPWLPLAEIVFFLAAMTSGAWPQNRPPPLLDDRSAAGPAAQPPESPVAESLELRAAELEALLDRVNDLIEQWIASEAAQKNLKRRPGWEARSAIDFYSRLEKITTAGTGASALEMAAALLEGKSRAAPAEMPSHETGYVAMRRELLRQGLMIIAPLRLRALPSPEPVPVPVPSRWRTPVISALAVLLASMASYLISVFSVGRARTKLFLRRAWRGGIQALRRLMNQTLSIFIVLHLGVGEFGTGGMTEGDPPASRKASAAGADAPEWPPGISPESWWGKLFETLLTMHGKAHFDAGVWNDEMRASTFHNLQATFMELREAGILDETVTFDNLPQEWKRKSVKQLAELVAFMVAPWEEARELLNTVCVEIYRLDPYMLRKPEEIRPYIRIVILQCVWHYLEAPYGQVFIKGNSITKSKLEKAQLPHLVQLTAALDDGTGPLADFLANQVSHLAAGGSIPAIPVAVKVPLYKALSIYNMLLKAGSPFLLRPDIPPAPPALLPGTRQAA